MRPVGAWARRGQSDPQVGSETSGGRGQRPPRRLSDRESAPNPGRREGKRVPCGYLGRRPKATRSAPKGSVSPVGCCRQRRQSDPQARRKEACALWREGKRVPGGHLREAQSDPKRGSETMSATVREARMIEQPGHLGRRPKAVSYTHLDVYKRQQQIIFFIVSPRFPLFVAACPQAARFLLRSVPINDFAHAPDRMRASCTAFPSCLLYTSRCV